MKPRIVQLLPAAHADDATGESALHLAAAAAGAGYSAEVYALTIDEALRDRVQPLDSMTPTGDGDLTLLHFAIPSPLSGLLQEARGTRALVYHNLTPPGLLLPFCPDVARLTARGEVELRKLAASGRVDAAIGVSEFNCRGLREAGFDRPQVLPLALDLTRYDVPSDPVVAAELVGAPPTFLTVGRVAPNKRLETFVRAAAHYVAHIEPDARFVIIGGSRGLEPYADAVADLAARLHLGSRLRFVGRVPHADLVTWYRGADVYVCASMHEGFCAPLLEAMHFEVPILARHAAAVPETLGQAGVTFTDDDPAALAEMMHLLATDGPTRALLAARGRERVRQFAPDRVVRRWLQAIDAMIGTS